MSKGFPNLGNTCYMNAALQCLCHIPCLRNNYPSLILDVQKRSRNNNYTLMDKWIQLQESVWESDDAVVDTKPILMEFIQRCKKEDILFHSFHQNDTTDFLNTFMDFLHNSIKRKVNIKITGTPKNQYDQLKVDSLNKWKDFFESNYSYIIKEFNSKLISLLSCPECDHLVINHEPIMTIALTLKNNYKTIYDCLDEFTREEKLDIDNQWKCEKCNNHVSPNKKLTFWELSDIIIISIKQFRLNQKINQHIDFPEVLTLNKYCMNLRNINYTYDLIGLCIHQGSLNGGHYYAICKNIEDNQWNIHNDTNVTPTTIEDIKNENPYCFFYVKRKV